MIHLSLIVFNVYWLRIWLKIAQTAGHTLVDLCMNVREFFVHVMTEWMLFESMFAFNILFWRKCNFPNENHIHF